MRVGQFLQNAGHRVISCRPEDTVQTAASLLTANRIGAMPVCDANGKLVGVLSERDIVRGLSERPAEVLRLLVSDLMTSNVITENTDTDMCDTMPVMAKNRFRHLPILDDGRLVGMISIRDSLAVQLQERELEAGVLRDNVIAARYR